MTWCCPISSFAAVDLASISLAFVVHFAVRNGNVPGSRGSVPRVQLVWHGLEDMQGGVKVIDVAEAGRAREHNSPLAAFDRPKAA